MVFVLAVMIVVSAALTRGHQAGAPQTKVIEVSAERFLFTPSEITVEPGTMVELRLVSQDTSHGFRLLGPGDINVEIPKRGKGDIRVMFDASEPGEYTFECSRVCGAGHNFMRGTLRVKKRTDKADGQRGGGL